VIFSVQYLYWLTEDREDEDNQEDACVLVESGNESKECCEEGACDCGRDLRFSVDSVPGVAEAFIFSLRSFHSVKQFLLMESRPSHQNDTEPVGSHFGVLHALVQHFVMWLLRV
jgi:hypothetical protein